MAFILMSLFLLTIVWSEFYCFFVFLCLIPTDCLAGVVHLSTYFSGLPLKTVKSQNVWVKEQVFCSSLLDFALIFCRCWLRPSSLSVFLRPFIAIISWPIGTNILIYFFSYLMSRVVWHCFLHCDFIDTLRQVSQLLTLLDLFGRSCFFILHSS